MLERKTVEKKEEEKQAKKQKMLKSAYRDLFQGLFKTAGGKLILKDLERMCHIKMSTFVPNSDDTVFNEGKRYIFLYIMDMANIEITKPKEAVND